MNGISPPAGHHGVSKLWDNVTVVVVPVPVVLTQAGGHVSIQVAAVRREPTVALRHWSHLQEWHGDRIDPRGDWFRLVNRHIVFNLHVSLAGRWEAEEAGVPTSRLIVTAASAHSISGTGIPSIKSRRNLTCWREKRMLHLRSYYECRRAWVVDVIKRARTSSARVAGPR